MQIESRPADHLQNVGCGSLLFQGFGQLARSNLHLLEQTGNLHRDQRLLCEGIDEGDLAFGEGAHGLAEKHYHADYRLILQQRYAEPGSRDLAVTAGVVSREIRQDVGQVHRFALERNASGDRTGSWWYGRKTLQRHRIIIVA